MNTEELIRHYNHQKNHFAFYEWLLEHDRHTSSTVRRYVLFGWADEMATLQEQVNQTGEPVDYVQRGTFMRTLRPEKMAA